MSATQAPESRDYRRQRPIYNAEAEAQAQRLLKAWPWSTVSINPRISDAQALILDDAHAGENFIASMWSVDISRSDNAYIYQAIVSLLRGELDTHFYSNISETADWDPAKADMTELVSAAVIRKYERAIRDLLNLNLKNETSPRYAWEAVKDHLAACNLFISRDSILIRPFIPPTQTHAPFEQATQRIYMSATLGAGGELERITGVKSIVRLPIPAGWDKRGSGRRLFLIPELAMTDEDMLEVVKSAVQQFKRSLILVPSQYDPEGRSLTEAIRQLDVGYFDADDIEDSLEPFLESDNAALLLSRYDGLDLPDDACRLLIMGGLPCGINLQEKFLWDKIKASSLLRDRVLTRFAQGVGRCTRSDNDYAVVLIIGRRLVDFLLKDENLRTLNPELQAELKFGIDNSEHESTMAFQELWDAFLSKSEEWIDAESAILARRDSLSRHDDPVSCQLKSVVADEVAYVYAIWSENYEDALGHARRVADALSGDEPKAYRAWWYYLTSEVARVLYEATKEETLLTTAREFLVAASSCCIGVNWFARLGRSLDAKAKIPIVDEWVSAAVEIIREHLINWGAKGPRFEQEIGQIANNIKSAEYKAFHRGLEGLGKMLGFKTELPEDYAAPDCLWSIKSLIHVVHEAKSQHTPEGSIGVRDIQQAQGHEKWIQANRACENDTKILCLIDSPRMTVDQKAKTHAELLYHVTPAELMKLYDEIAAILRRVRSRWTHLSDEKALEELTCELVEGNLTPRKVLERLSQRLVADMESTSNDSGKPKSK